jgi:integrase
MGLYKRDGSKFWWVKFHFKGKIINQSSKVANRKEADKIQAIWKANLAKGQPMIERAVPTLGEFLKKDFLPHVETEHKAVPKTLMYYFQGTNRLLSSSLAKVELNKVTSQHATRFTQQHGELTASTINQALRTLRRALNLAEEWKVLDRAPRIKLAKGENQRDRVLSEEEFNRYILACAQPWQDVATIMYCLGMRPSEVYGLTWEQISLADGFIQILRGKSKAARRQLPLVPVVRRLLEARFRQQGQPTEGWVFPSESKSGHLEQGSAKNQHLKALEKSKVKHFASYCLRHTCLTNLAKETDQFTLKTAAGHSSITMTQRYIHPLQKTIRDGFQRVAEKQKLVTVSDTGENFSSSEEGKQHALNSAKSAV